MWLAIRPNSYASTNNAKWKIPIYVLTLRMAAKPIINHVLSSVYRIYWRRPGVKLLQRTKITNLANWYQCMIRQNILQVQSARPLLQLIVLKILIWCWKMEDHSVQKINKRLPDLWVIVVSTLLKIILIFNLKKSWISLSLLCRIFSRHWNLAGIKKYKSWKRDFKGKKN